MTPSEVAEHTKIHGVGTFTSFSLMASANVWTEAATSL
jgi:hypothetical protein